jgi:hypothetical protein
VSTFQGLPQSPAERVALQIAPARTARTPVGRATKVVLWPARAGVWQAIDSSGLGAAFSSPSRCCLAVGAGGCQMFCTDGASCHLPSCGGGCNLECDGARCDLDRCGVGCRIACDRGRTCQIGECTDGGCQIGPIGNRAEGSTLVIADCRGGDCSIECAAGDTCTIGACSGGGCTISCEQGAACNCAAAGCTVIVP